MRYFRYLLVLFIAQSITWVITPLLPILAVSRTGALDNNNSSGLGPRLPKRLSWLDTPDNSLFGDSKWNKEHSGTYIDQVKWLYRNSLYGFKWTVLSLPEGHPDAWQWHKKPALGNKYYLDLNFGWMLDNIENGVAMFHFSPRLKRM